MTYPIKELVINSDDFSTYSTGQEETKKTLDNLSKINILIGTNNSGKSRLLRNLFKLVGETKFKYKPNQIPLINFINSKLDFIGGEINKILQKNGGYSDYGGIIAAYQSLKKVQYIEQGESFTIALDNFLHSLQTTYAQTAQQAILPGGSIDGRNHNWRYIASELNEMGLNISEEYSNFEKPDHQFERIYIPTLRGLRPFDEGGNVDLYTTRTSRDYFGEEKKDTDHIFTGMHMNESIKRRLLGSLQDRELIDEFQDFLKDNFFDGQSILLLPSLDRNFLRVKIGDEKEQEIHQLGDGIQHIIILTYQLFLHKGKNLMVFIEEPELYLHPGLQRTLLETFISHGVFKGFQFFFTTHSNHFLDLTLDIEDISVYTLRKTIDDGESKEKTPTFHIENVSNEDYSVLDLLGVKNSSVFMSNCTIWVEGVTDRFYIRRYLNLYQDQLQNSPRFREDYHYSFVEYSGGNITHFTFLDESDDPNFRAINAEKICSRMFLITDRDNSKWKEERQQKLQKRLGPNYKCLESREIENTLSKNVLLKVVAEYEKVTIEELQHKQFDVNDYKEEYLGAFIEEVLISRKRKKYRDASGTITQKLEFCKKAIKHINHYDDLSDEAKQLCEVLYNFIKQSNP